MKLLGENDFEKLLLFSCNEKSYSLLSHIWTVT